ncbi:MAG: hypothetical protein HYS53_02525 [Candidatus Aenigmarchaeota archaeon]|nr:hypothetical protein [Candidatus Aenigmarchaeota archaeon]
MLSHKKGFGQDQVFLLAGILILFITAYVIYTLIGGPYCDDLAKKTANNIKVAVDTVATTGTYTKDSPYTTYAMLCQNKVGSPLTLNPVDYRALSTPEYMIYWEHFPESPENLAQGLYKFDESYPFTKNMAQIIGINMGLSLFSGTLSSLKASGIGGQIASKVSKTRAGEVAEYFAKGAKIIATPITLPLKGVEYLGGLATKGLTNSMKFIFEVTGVDKIVLSAKKWITAKTAPNIFGRTVGLGFLKTMDDNGLIEVIKIQDDLAEELGDQFAVKMVNAEDTATGELVQKAVVPAGKRAELQNLINKLGSSAVEEEKQMGRNLDSFFAYKAADVALQNEITDLSKITFRKIVQDSETADKGFYGLMNGAMKKAKESFDANSRKMAARYGLYPSRPITSFFEQTGIKRFSKSVDAIPVFRSMRFFDDQGNLLPEISENIQKRFAGLKLETQITDPDSMAAITGKFFASDKAIIAGAETDTAIFSFLESSLKTATDGAGTGVTSGAYGRFLSGTATDGDVASIASKLRSSYITELKAAGVGDDVIESVNKKFDVPNYGKRLLRDYESELKLANSITGDADDALEIAKFSASWKREPEMLALMAKDEYEFLPYAIYDSLDGWSPKGTSKFIKMNVMGYAASDVEDELKYSYLKSPNAGCESNTVCLNQKGVEQRKSDVAEERIKDYETVYVVSKAVDLKLKRDGFTSPLGAGLGAFSFEKNPRFHLVSPCLAQISFYEDGSKNGEPVVIADVDKCPTPGRSNYCYFDEGKFNEMAAGFYGSLACSVIADVGKLAVYGWLLQPACNSIEMWTEYDTTWPFRPFEPLKNIDMNILQCNIEKNPKDAAKLAMRACCGIAQCTGDFVCSGVDYAEKNALICGANKCTLGQLAKAAGEDYKTVCGCS